MKSIITFFMMSAAVAVATESVDVNLNVRHSVGGVDSFQRDVYILLHAGLRDNDWDSASQRSSFLTDYDVYLGRNNGSLPWQLSQVDEHPTKDGWVDLSDLQSNGTVQKNNYAADTAVHPLEFRRVNMMIGGQMSMYPNGQINGNGFAITNYAALGDYFEHYMTYFHGTGTSSGEPKPAMVEVVNEPFVAASKYGTTKENIAHMHNEVATRIRNSNSDIMVGGYTAAHPAYESGNFGHWDSNWRMFIDVAGTNMDFFSLHMYDYLDKDETTDPAMTQYRSGSNIEALMDMIEHYSMLSLGEIKPFAISEFGAFEPKDGGEPWSAENDWSDIRSYSTILMQLLERPDRMLQAMPFMILKAEWGRNSETGNPYGPRLLRQNFEEPGQTGNHWVYTERIKWFELWKEVAGTRIDTMASDPDIQVDAYVDGNDAYVIVSSLDHTGPQTINLNLFGASAGLQQVEVKHCYKAVDDKPALDHYVTNTLPSITLGASATAVLKYTFASSQVIDEVSDEKKYYATSYLRPINAGTPIVFSITNVNASSEFGEAVLRLGFGREHGKSLAPALYVNGTYVPVPADWRGYDQSTRSSFFGVLEIPVHYDLLQSNNTISLTFDDPGGHVSCVSMQVFEQSANVRDTAFTLSSDIAGPDMIIGVSNAPANSYYSLLSASNLVDGAWETNQTELPIDSFGSGSVTSPVSEIREFYRVVLSNPPPPPPPPEATVIDFTAPDYGNGPLNGQQNWNAEAGWIVADATVSGHVATAVNSEIAVLNEPIQLSEGEIYTLSVNFQFGGGPYVTPTGWVYAFMAGMRSNSTAVAEATGNTAADANIQIIQNTDSYRLLSNYSNVSGTSLIEDTELNAGDILQFDYALTLGTNAAGTAYSVRLQNLTDGTDTGAGTVNGVEQSVYDALTGSGAYGFFQSIDPGNNGSGLAGTQVNSVSTSVVP